MAEHEAPLLVLAADAGNNGSIRLLWRGCQASKHFLFILAVGMAGGMQDPLHACPRGGQGGHRRCCRTCGNRPQWEPRRLLELPLPAAAPAPLPALAPPACPSPTGCRLAPGSLQGGGTARALFPQLWGWVWGHPALSLPCPLPQAPGAQPQLTEPPSSRGRGYPHPARFPHPNPRLSHPAPGPDPSSNPPEDRLGVSDGGPKSGCCRGGARLRLAGGRPSTRGAGGGRGRSLGNSQTTAMGPTGRTRLPVSWDTDPGAGQAAEQGLQLEQRPRQGLPVRPRHCQTSAPSFDMV